MRPLAAVAIALAAAMAIPAVTLGAGNKLTNPSVSPTSGSTTTTFVFTVSYSGDDAASNFRAVAGGVTVALSRISGTATNGTWRGTHTLPAGTWPVTFYADASGPPTNPMVTGPTVVVTGPTPPPTPTPGPTATPRPTPAPTPAPTPVQTAGASPTAAASSSPAASAAGTPTASSSGAAGGSANPSASSSSAAGGVGGGDDLTGQLGTILTGGLAAIGLLAVVGFAAIWRDRRRREEEGESDLLQPLPSAARPSQQARPLADWERDFAYDDEPIGTIEYHRPGDEVQRPEG